MSSASSNAQSGDIIYGNADSSGTSSTLIIGAVIAVVAIVVLVLFKSKSK
jgi:hypothetical protein